MVAWRLASDYTEVSLGKLQGVVEENVTDRRQSADST
jgi:hypothetical protein